MITGLLDQPVSRFVEFSGGASIYKDVRKTGISAGFDKVEQKRVANAFGRGMDPRSEGFRFNSIDFTLSAFRYAVAYGQRPVKTASHVELGEPEEEKDVPVSDSTPIQGVVATYTGPRFGNTQPTFKEFLGNPAYAKWNLQPYIESNIIRNLRYWQTGGGSSEHIILYGQTADSEIVIVCDSYSQLWGIGNDPRYFDPEQFWPIRLAKKSLPNADGIGSQVHLSTVRNRAFDLRRLQVDSIGLRKRGTTIISSFTPFKGKTYIPLEAFLKAIDSGDVTKGTIPTITIR